jgi:hypothetical protein
VHVPMTQDFKIIRYAYRLAFDHATPHSLLCSEDELLHGVVRVATIRPTASLFRDAVHRFRQKAVNSLVLLKTKLNVMVRRRLWSPPKKEEWRPCR